MDVNLFNGATQMHSNFIWWLDISKWSLNINGNFRNKKKFIKIKGCTFKITNIHLARHDLNTMRDLILNVEFEWDPEQLSDEPPLEGPSIPITILMVKKVISKMKFSTAAGPSGVVVEMIRAAVDTCATVIRDIAIHSKWEGPS